MSVTGGEVLAISVDANGFEVDNQGFNFHNVSTSTIDGAFCFALNDAHIICIGKFFYQYNLSLIHI